MKDAKFRFAVEKTLAHEGGYVNDPADPGGETNFGISKRSYPDLDIESLTRFEAMQIYKKDYWDPNRYDGIDDKHVAAKGFDLAVVMGPRKANRILQIAMNTAFDYGVESPSVYVTTRGPVLVNDGRIGEKTLCAINGFPRPEHLLDRVRLLAARYFLGLERTRYAIGWVRRALG